MFGATGNEIHHTPEDPSSFEEGAAHHEDGTLPADAPDRPGLLGWLACTLLHRRAHRWYPRYLGSYGCCPVCGREWD